MSVQEEVRQLALLVPSPPNEKWVAGATDEAISEFQTRTGVVVPPSLQEWLRFANGPCIGPGGMLGIRPERPSLDIEEVLRSYASWKDQGWIPIAGDGCGNYYVIDATEDGGVYFIDATTNMSRPAYAVSSNLWSFLWFLLNRELGHKGWPFQKDYVTSRDPDIVKCARAPLPWNF